VNLFQFMFTDINTVQVTGQTEVQLY
jgi:hypothetical protein